MRTWFYRLARVSLVLTFFVIIIGAWVRLTDAGLGCPDWPGCYGQLLVPQSEQALAAAETVRPDRAVDTGAAWREMIHRYLAGTLGMLVLAMAVLAVRNRDNAQQPVALPLFLAGLIIFQSLLGMWTVTLLLKPAIVMAHLLGGLATFALLFLIVRGERQAVRRRPLPLRALAGGALAVLIAQIALGGWVSANYAALACPDFPTCQTQWWPQGMDFREGFVLWREVGVDYEFGVLDAGANTAIHMTHRLGALLTAGVLGFLGIAALRREGQAPEVRRAAALMLAALAVQITLGVLLIEWRLPLALATAHNGMAALLLLSVLNLNLVLRRFDAREPQTAPIAAT